MRMIFLVLALLLGVIVAVAAIINNEVVTVNYLFGQVNLTLFMLILGSALAGALFMGSLGIFRSIHNYAKYHGDRNYKKGLKRNVKDLEDDKSELKDELQQQQKDREDTAAKVNASLGKKNDQLEDKLKKQQKDHEREMAKAHNS